MTDTIKKSYNVSGCGVLSIDGDVIYISVKDKGDFNLAKELTDLDGCTVEFYFSHDEDVQNF